MSYSLNFATPDRGVEWVRPFAEWLKQHGQRGILTEFGVPNNDPRWLELTRGLLVYLAQEKIPWTYCARALVAGLPFLSGAEERH